MNKIVGLNKLRIRLILRLIKWHISHYIFHRDFPLLATFQLTNRCNFNCRMCNIKNNPVQDTLAFEAFRKIIDELGDLGCIYVSLSGGEPLLINNIADYIAYAKRRIPVVNLVTNGYLLSQEFAKTIELLSLDSLSISLDALGRSHDDIRGVPGAFDRAISAITVIKKLAPHVKITVNTVISSWNLDGIIELVNFTEQLGIRHKFQPLYKHPDFDNQPDKHAAPGIKRIDIKKLDYVVDYLKNKKNVSNSAYFLSCIPDYFSSNYKKEIFNTGCLFPSFSCEFREDGKLYPCIVGKFWQNGYNLENGVRINLSSKAYQDDVNALKKCRLCRDNFSVCYIEPRLMLPFTNLIKYNL